jgi:hypothetical protein
VLAACRGLLILVLCFCLGVCFGGGGWRHPGCGHAFGPRVAAGTARGSTARGPAGAGRFLLPGGWRPGGGLGEAGRVDDDLGVPANRLAALAQYGLAAKAPALRDLAEPRKAARLPASCGSDRTVR